MTVQSVDINLYPDSQIPTSRIRMGETGWTGLRISNGILYEERRKFLRWPNAIKTYKEMSEDATIASAINLLEMLICRVNWTVVTKSGASATAQKRAKFIESCMDDMDHSWFQFVKELVSYITFGFSVHELVWRRRLQTNGSRYNDGLIGMQKMPIRGQDTIRQWKFSEDGRTLIGLIQDLALVNNITRYEVGGSFNQTRLPIPREKFLLFRADVRKDNPEGKSPLAACYTAWKYRTALEETQAVGLTRGLHGLPVVTVPSRIMADDATDGEKAVYAYWQKVIRNIQNNEQGGLIIPGETDPESRQPFYKFELVTPQGGATYDAGPAIERWDNKILQCLFADLLSVGKTGVGAYNLADSKTTILGMAIEHRLREIQSILNNELIPAIYKMNKWDQTELPFFQFSDIQDQDLDEFSKAIQRIGSNGLIARTPENINRIAEVLNLPHRVDADVSPEELSNLMGNPTSRASDGMSLSSMDGTALTATTMDTSTMNSDNAS